MLELNLDYAKNVDLLIRRNSYTELSITVLLDSVPYSFTGGKVKIMLLGNKINSNPFVTKTSSIDSDYISITSNVISLKLWQDLSNINPGKYFWVLVFTDSSNKAHYWLVGDYRVVSGYSEEDILTEAIIINITEPTENIYLNIFLGGSGNVSYSSVYTALLTQSGNTAPSAIVLSNTIIPLPTWSRISAGKYKFTNPGGFNLSKTSITPIRGISNYLTPNYVKTSFDTDNNLLVETWDTNQVPSDSILSSFQISIQIFI